jgi:NADH-quinone oxidoreductase subunit J
MGREWAKGLLCLFLLMGLVWAAFQEPAWRADTPLQENWPGLADALFNKWLLAFELVSVLLLAALVGALYLSRKTPRGEEENA